MIKLVDLISETVSDKVLRLSKAGASKQFLRDFDKVFKKKSKELGYGKLDKKVQSRNVQVSKPAGFDKAIKYEKMQGIELSYQFDEGVIPGRKSYKYDLDDFKKENIKVISANNNFFSFIFLMFYLLLNNSQLYHFILPKSYIFPKTLLYILK